MIREENTTMHTKFPIISFIVCFVAILILCRLGAWQIERLEWKNNLQQNLDDAFAEVQPQSFVAEHFAKLEKGQIIRGTAQGRLDLSKAVLFHGRIEGGKSVMTVVAPFIIPSLNVTVPVEVGCSINPDVKSLGIKQVVVRGVLRLPSWTFVTPANVPAQGEWWRLDTQELTNYWHIESLKSGVMTAENTADLVAGLTPCIIEKHLRNDHQSYAIFWFAMAGVLMVMWVIRFLKPYLQSA